MVVLYIVTLLALGVSVVASPSKTWQAIKVAFKKFIHILPAFIIMLILISLVLYALPEKTISTCLARHNQWLGILLAAVLGSITLMPGFIAFPLSGILLKTGVSYTVIATFTTTLMMVGIVTYPIEKAYFGNKVTIIRNIMSLGIALVVALCIGFIFGEFS